MNFPYLVLATPQSLKSGGTVRVTGSDGHEDLTDVDTGDETVGLSESTTHTGLQPIGTSARQHLVDTDDVVGVDTDSEMETFLSGNLDKVLVGANTGSFESLSIPHRRQTKISFPPFSMQVPRTSEDSCSYSLETK